MAQISTSPLVLCPETVAEVERATVAATRFDAVEAHRVLPFTPLLLRSESVASSRIEQLTSSARKILEAEMTGGGTGNAALIAANTRQMARAVESGEPTVASVLEIHRLLLAESAPNIAGRFRDQPVWIGSANSHPGGAPFVPPHQRYIAGLMADLETFMQREDMPALAQAAVAHAQFETIHPFADGNGRTGRALVHVVLRNRGVSSSVALPISAGLLTDVGGYFDALTAYREGTVEPIVLLFAQAALEGAERGTWLADELMELREEWDERLHARADSLAWPLLDLLLQHPIVTSTFAADALGTTSARARKALNRLEEDGIVVSAQLGKRARAWRSPDVLDLLDEFAERAGRRE
ncbi:Fic family protein [Corynebacterium aquatimens]|uniref:Fic family protein n=1 Tax=Corynebacterium aquatimens TaxID=1190508 RepID=UPI0025412304|nr:Fic family protein [Corynebacterium aquatimens]QYH19041.1 Fic family protein [Corynebacterium aquatimens]